MAQLPLAWRAGRVRLSGEATADAGDEAELVARATKDRAAFAPLYRRYFDPVYRYCYRRLGNPEAAADATSLVFTKALAALPTCRTDSFRSWLFAIAHNVIADAHRARRADQPLDERSSFPDPAPSPEAEAVAAADRDRLRSLLAQLTPDQQAVVELRLAGLSGQEIAVALGKTRGAVDAVQFRAVARLRLLLDGDQGTDREDHDAGR